MENPDKPGSLWLSGDTNPGLVLVGIEYSHRSLLKKRKGGDGGDLPLQRKPLQEFLQQIIEMPAPVKTL